MAKPTNQQVHDYVQHNIAREGELELDDFSPKNFSRAKGNPDKGCYVKLWKWVPDENVVEG